MKTFLLFLAFLLFNFTSPAQVNLTPEGNLGLQRVKVEVPNHFIPLVDTSKFYVNIPPGYHARLFYTGGLVKPRFMAFDPDGVLHVTDGGNGKIYALPDANIDGIADTAILVASGFTNNHDIKFYKGDLYVTESTRVVKLVDANNDGLYESQSNFITGIPGAAGHSTRTIVFDSLNQKVYLSIGSSCNVCRESDRAIIEQYDDDGTNKRTYAYGVRNAVGMTLHPVTNRLWSNNNGSDWQGNEIPAEWIDLVRDSGFYGHPFAYGNQVWFDFDAHSDYVALKPITATDSMHVSKMVQPAALIRAHSASMAIEFLNPSFPTLLRNGFMMALRGSWNTPNAYRGYKVVYMDLSNSNDTTVNYVADFVSGFLTDSVQRHYWARPVGLAIANDGSFFLTSDETNTFVMQIYPDSTVSMKENFELNNFNAFPNPFNNSLTFSFLLDRPSAVHLKIWDITGRLMIDKRSEVYRGGLNQFSVGTEELGEGVYVYEIGTTNGFRKVARVVKQRSLVLVYKPSPTTA